MTDNEKPVAVSTETTKGGHTSLELHEYEKEHLFLGNATAGIGYAKLFDKDVFYMVFSKVSDSRWPVLQQWNKAYRVVTFISSLAAFCSIFFESERDRSMSTNTVFATVKRYSFHCKNNFQVGFAMYVNLALCVYMLLLVVGSALIKRRNLRTGETTSAAVLWAFFIANIIIVSCSLLAFAGSMGVDVLNKIRTTRYCEDSRYRRWSDKKSTSECMRLRHYCSGLGSALWTSFLASASFVAGTYVDGHRILSRRGETSPDGTESAKQYVDGYERLLDENATP